MNVLAIGAHPDDLELQCFGTLALYAAWGHRVFAAVATNGDKGNDDVDPAELALNPLKLGSDGYLTVPSAPGLGIELNEQTIEKYTIEKLQIDKL